MQTQSKKDLDKRLMKMNEGLTGKDKNNKIALKDKLKGKKKLKEA